MAEQELENTAAPNDLPALIILLLKGVIYQEADAGFWNALLNLQARVRDYVVVLGLELVLDEAEGYAFLRSRSENEDDATPKLPRLVARRSLSFPVSLLLALLRKKLAEFDASGGDTRLVLSRNEIVELIRVFLPDSSNEAKLIDQIETHLNKIVELGFLRKLKPSIGQTAVFEVRRILKAFVDAQWLVDFDARLTAYQVQLGVTLGGAADDKSAGWPICTTEGRPKGDAQEAHHDKSAGQPICTTKWPEGCRARRCGMNDQQLSRDFMGDDALSGFRLHRLEVFNWGTFDGRVWALNPDGKNALLTGVSDRASRRWSMRSQRCLYRRTVLPTTRPPGPTAKSDRYAPMCSGITSPNAMKSAEQPSPWRYATTITIR